MRVKILCFDNKCINVQERPIKTPGDPIWMNPYKDVLPSVRRFWNWIVKGENTIPVVDPVLNHVPIIGSLKKIYYYKSHAVEWCNQVIWAYIVPHFSDYDPGDYEAIRGEFHAEGLYNWAIRTETYYWFWSSLAKKMGMQGAKLAVDAKPRIRPSR